MSRIIKLTEEELIKMIAGLRVGMCLDFATNCAYLDRDLDKANEDDLTNWYGIKKIYEFDQEIVLIGGYGGDCSYAISYKWSDKPSEDFDYNIQIALDNIYAHENEVTGIYVVGEAVDTKPVDNNGNSVVGGVDWGFDTSIADTLILLAEVEE